MVVVQGTTALASEVSTLIGEINRWFSDNYAESIAFGNSNQTYGWGDTTADIVIQGELIEADEVNPLVDRCNIGQNILSAVTGTLPQIALGALITATEINNIESKSDLITTNRLDIDAAELSLIAGGSSIRSTNWGAAAVDCTFRYTFASFDEARYFFNSGGAFNISATITGYSIGTSWDGEGFNEIFTNMGTILMNYTQTTQSGSGGTPTAIGYYDLTEAYQTIFSQTGSGAYTDAALVIEARYGASGAYVEVRVTLTPGSGRSVDGTTTITTQHRKLDNQASGVETLTITAPTYSLINAL